MTPPHAHLPPSPWITRFGALLQTLHAQQPQRRALDVACGWGRHTRWLVQQGYRVTAVDRDAEALAALDDMAATVTRLAADLEAAPWPLPGQTFDVVLVTNYLWRPLLPHLLASLAPGGVLLYETFAWGQQTIGRPARPEFLLAPGELLQVCAGLRIVAYEDGYDSDPARYVQRVAALRPPQPAPSEPLRLPLTTPSTSGAAG
ncbi:class I SAM-dependent methyltransferase [Tepidimonas aquatica]|uniref:TehB: tellurite resistance protein TehB n=1 Tax=Tepidimonas aquatica TaxID=247482 RepID=A0A554WVN8_9BURK|nr:class I SAM-dependent methyltransferase [Tepidimonas aquatica]TSE27639.1 tehB: tellurite resistance protein TehB [Tepidimonas aquatica]